MDQSEAKLVCMLFNASIDALPKIYKIGDIVRFHRIKVILLRFGMQVRLSGIGWERSYGYPPNANRKIFPCLLSGLRYVGEELKILCVPVYKKHGAKLILILQGGGRGGNAFDHMALKIKTGFGALIQENRSKVQSRTVCVATRLL